MPQWKIIVYNIKSPGFLPIETVIKDPFNMQ